MLNVIVFAFLLLLQLHLVKNLIQRKVVEKFQVFFIFIFVIMLTVRNLPDSIISWLMLEQWKGKQTSGPTNTLLTLNDNIKNCEVEIRSNF